MTPSPADLESIEAHAKIGSALTSGFRADIMILISALRERDAEIERLREQVDALNETDALFRRHVARKNTALKQADAALGEIYIEFNQDQILVDTARTDITTALANDKEPGR